MFCHNNINFPLWGRSCWTFALKTDWREEAGWRDKNKYTPDTTGPISEEFHYENILIFLWSDQSGGPAVCSRLLTSIMLPVQLAWPRAAIGRVLHANYDWAAGCDCLSVLNIHAEARQGQAVLYAANQPPATTRRAAGWSLQERLGDFRQHSDTHQTLHRWQIPNTLSIFAIEV